MSIGCGSGSSVKPSIVTLSSISMTFSYNLSSLLTDKSNRFGLAWFPITKRSTKPFVIKSATRSPFRSNNALFYISLYSFTGMGRRQGYFVATVVPIRMDSTLLKSRGVPLGIEVPEASSSILRTPSVGASGYWSGQTESNLKTTSSFWPGMFAQKSAKVPPVVC